MADSATRSKQSSGKKRKQKAEKNTERPAKAPRRDERIEEAEVLRTAETVATPAEKEGERCSQWSNLEIVMAIESKELDAQKKVDMVLEYMKSGSTKDIDDDDEAPQTLSFSRVIMHVSNWIQSLFISSEKKARVVAGDGRAEHLGFCLDYRCWEIFRICLKESLELHVTLSLSRDLLRVIGCIARNALSSYKVVTSCKNGFLERTDSESYGLICDCVNLIFFSHGGISNGNLDLWVGAGDSLLKLAIKVYEEGSGSNGTGNLLVKLCCLVLESFSRFLRVHPCRKTGFRDFVAKLLKPLLHLLGLLHDQIDGSILCTADLHRCVEEVMSLGLFHPVHVEDFLSLRTTEGYSSLTDGTLKDSKAMIKSYHRHLFDKLENIALQKNVVMFYGIGELFHLFINSVNKQRRDVVTGGRRRFLEAHSLDPVAKSWSTSRNIRSEKDDPSPDTNMLRRNSMFDFFVLSVEPLLLDMKSMSEVGASLLYMFWAVKSTNKMLSTIIDEKLYHRTEDATGGAILNFFKVTYHMIFSYCVKVNEMWLQTGGKDRVVRMDMLIPAAKELVLALKSFVEIEYQVLGDALGDIWLAIISFLTMSHSVEEMPQASPLASATIDLACQLLKLYSDLRQVGRAVFALCSCLRHLPFHHSSKELKDSRFVFYSSPSSYGAVGKSTRLLLCTPKFRRAIYKAIKAIPEGQVSECLGTLTADISASLEWINANCSAELENKPGRASCFGLDVVGKLLGALSEIYTKILDSVSVTAGNSKAVAVCVEKLIMMLRPQLGSVLAHKQCDNDEFVIFTNENTLQSKKMKHKTDAEHVYPWMCFFFFHLYVYCRSLFRQVISLMPPDTSKEMSAAFGDPLNTCCGSDWMSRVDLKDEGYFSWILWPSASLHTVIESIVHNFGREGSAGCSPLIYVMFAIALQRLTDLNGQIHSLDYLVLADDSLLQSRSIEGSGPSRLRKKRKRWQKRLSLLRQEAASLTDFVMGYISKIEGELLPMSAAGKSTASDPSLGSQEKSDPWDLAVGSVDENTLPIALWRITCQNLDLWCVHASKTKLKLFLSILIRSAVQSGGCDLEFVRKDVISYPSDMLGVTVHRISLELLHDAGFYEQKFVRRYLASSFCHALEKILPLSADSTNKHVDLKSSVDWKEVLIELENSPIAVNQRVAEEHCPKQTSLALQTSTIAAFQNFLHLLSQVPKRSLTRKSFTLYATLLLNCERVVVGGFVESCRVSPLDKRTSLLRMLVSCRRALKCLAMEFCEDRIESNEHLILPIFSESSGPILWLLKSVQVVQQHYDMYNDEAVNKMFYSLMDHTSYMFVTLCKYQCSCVILLSSDEKNLSEEHPGGGCIFGESGPSESACRTSSSISDYAGKCITSMAETLEDQMQVTLSNVPAGQASEPSLGMGGLNKTLTLISCCRGFLQGLASSLDLVGVEGCDSMMKLLKNELFSCNSISQCIDKFVEIMDSVSHILMDSTREPDSTDDAQQQFQSDNDVTLHEIGQPLQKVSDDTNAMEYKDQQLDSGIVDRSLLSSDVDDDSDSGACIKNPTLDKSELSDSFHKRVGSFTEYRLREGLLRDFLRGENLKLSFLLREILLASSAVLRLNMQTKCSPLSSSLMKILFGCSQFLFVELSNIREVPKPYSFALLDGCIKYLEEMGRQFAATSGNMTMDFYSRLINLYLKALGKCITLQGKRATLASPDVGSSIKTSGNHISASDSYVSHEQHHIEELKDKLKMSFVAIIKGSSESEQVMERALLGVQESWAISHELNTWDSAGGSASSVAAGIDCLDLVLECVTGHKRLSAVRRHIQSLVASVFNIIFHRQGPGIFCGNLNINEADAEPDPGAVILMCVELLIKITRKHALFRMNPGHVGQYLRIPAALFQDFHHLKVNKHTSNNLHAASSLLLNRQFSLNLYAASCRLLSTIVKHHKSECIQCIALLQSSVQVLLYSLELVDIDKEGYFSWDVQEGVNCASHLRRVYEEIRQQRDVLGQHCFLFLSDYVWIYSGYSPQKRGIRREIDDALRPGVYALVDVCSANDLQYLHTVLGEGPCRSTLAALRQDYKLNFQYEGKV
ncbi:hypothetical protein Drorol1_Dr00001263 [Drosera rotundifolia]